MPIYEYQCPKCHSIFEEWVRMSDAHGEEPCPECGTLSPRLISHTSFVLKGGGWYVTDYGYRKGVKDEDSSSSSSSSGEGGSSGTTASADSKGESKGEGKGDAKPASSGKKAAGKSSGKSKSGSKGKTASK